jgi:hypothetical protein
MEAIGCPKRRQEITITRFIVDKKSAVLIYFATEAWRHAPGYLVAKIFPHKLLTPVTITRSRQRAT